MDFKWELTVGNKEISWECLDCAETCKAESEIDTKTESQQDTGQDTLLKVVMDEYNREKGRGDGLDIKSGVFISALIAFLTLYAQIIPFEAVKSVFTSQNIWLVVIITTAVLMIFVGLVFVCIAFYKLYKSFKPQEYKAVDVQSIADDEVKNQSKERIVSGLLNHYCSIITENRKSNENKAVLQKEGLLCCLVSFALLTVSALIILVLRS